jgi:hypothetical protein
MRAILSYSVYAASYEIKRADGTSITYYHDAPVLNSYKVMVLFRGVECQTSVSLQEQSKSFIALLGTAILTIEKCRLSATRKRRGRVIGIAQRSQARVDS